MKRASKWSESFVATYLKRHPLYAFGFVYVGLSLALAVVGPLIVPHSPTTSLTDAVLLSPSSTYWFGTDSNGMDVFSRTIAAYRTDLILAFAGAALSMLVGAPLGVYAGFFDGRGGLTGFLARVILRVEDVLQAFPIFVLALLLVAAFGPQPVNLVLAIVVANHISNLRLARSEVLTLRDRTFVEAARASGGSNMRIAFAHLLPNALNPVIAMLSTVMGFGILLIAGLSFVGAGVRVPTPEWGSMIAIGGPSIMTGQWWPSFFPGVFMAITIFFYSVVGEAVTALLDPLERIRMGYGDARSMAGPPALEQAVDADVAIAGLEQSSTGGVI